MSRQAVSELSLARAWADGAIPSSLSTTDGQSLSVIFRGAWTHGFGPDFSGAMISFADGRMLTGSIEIHLASSGWRAHGHHLDPAYNEVILHIVGVDDGGITRRADGATVPVAIVGFEQAKQLEAQLDWSRVGGEVCAEQQTRENPAAIVQAIHALGDQRLAAKAASLEAELVSRPPADLLWRGLLEALGYAENREPMRQLARKRPIGELQRLVSFSPTPLVTGASALLGLAGFLPLSPSDANAANLEPSLVEAIERSWQGLARPGSELMRPSDWKTARVRPANHPVARLLAAAALVAAYPEGVAAALLEDVRQGTLRAESLAGTVERRGAALGVDRATVILANAVLPLAIALSEHQRDPELADGAIRIWDTLSASAHNRVTRAAQLQVCGEAPLRGLGERGMQGLIHLHRGLCTPRRCFECPIAAIVVNDATPES